MVAESHTCKPLPGHGNDLVVAPGEVNAVDRIFLFLVSIEAIAGGRVPESDDCVFGRGEPLSVGRKCEGGFAPACRKLRA